MPRPPASRGDHDVNPASPAPPADRTALVPGSGSGPVDCGDAWAAGGDDCSDGPGHTVGPWRGLAVGVSLWLFIFLKGESPVPSPVFTVAPSPSHRAHSPMPLSHA